MKALKSFRSQEAAEAAEAAEATEAREAAGPWSRSVRNSSERNASTGGGGDCLTSERPGRASRFDTISCTTFAHLRSSHNRLGSVANCALSRA